MRIFDHWTYLLTSGLLIVGAILQSFVVMTSASLILLILIIRDYT